MAKRRSWSGPVPADEQRCTRNDGKNWRCYAPRSPGSIFCPKHHLAYLAKCRPNPNPKPPTIRGPHKNPFRRRPTTTATSTSTSTTARVSRTTPPLTPGEIWAFSNNSPSDQTPRHYARIDRTLPTILATPLIPHPILPEELLLTDTQNRTLSCGTFRPSPRKTAMHPSSFVFRMVGFKIITWMGIPFYRLFPNKEEVWAVSAKEGGGEVKMVEVVSDFSEEEGVTVAGLVPVEGKGDGVYGRHLHEGFRLVQMFGRREMVAFSHRVEAERVEGCEGDQQLWKYEAFYFKRKQQILTRMREEDGNLMQGRGVNLTENLQEEETTKKFRNQELRTLYKEPFAEKNQEKEHQPKKQEQKNRKTR